MPKIKFSYIFKNDIERVFEGFTEQISDKNLPFQNIITLLKYDKGQKLYEENAEFSFVWKNYYEIKMVVEKVIKQPFIKSYTHRTIYIDKLPIEMSFTFNFFWDSINENTIFILDLEYQDEFFTDLIKADFSEEDKLNLCKVVDNYLSTSLKGLESGSTCVLKAPLALVRQYILYPYLFFQIISKEYIFTLNEQEIYLDRKYELYVKSENKDIPLTVLIVESMVIEEFYIKVTYSTYKKISFPNIKFSLIFKQLANANTFFHYTVKPLEPVTQEMNNNLLSFWKKRMCDFCNFFEKNKKKDAK